MLFDILHGCIVLCNNFAFASVSVDCSVSRYVIAGQISDFAKFRHPLSFMLQANCVLTAIDAGVVDVKMHSLELLV